MPGIIAGLQDGTAELGPQVIVRHAREPWHFGVTRSAGTRSAGYGPPDGRRAVPSFVPPGSAPAIADAARRWSVSAALLVAELYAESNFDPDAVSPAGAPARRLVRLTEPAAGRYAGRARGATISRRRRCSRRSRSTSRPSTSPNCFGASDPDAQRAAPLPGSPRCAPGRAATHLVVWRPARPARSVSPCSNALWAPVSSPS